MIKCFYDGRLGADAELKTSQNGAQFYSMRVATDDYKNGNNETVWTNVIVNAERVGKMKFTKGSHVLITGTLRTSAYQTKSGESAVSVDVIADSIHYVRGGGSGATQGDSAVASGDNFGKLAKKDETAAPASAKKAAKPAAVVDSDPDDLPF